MKVLLLILSMLLQAPAPRGSVTGTVTVAGTAEPIPDAEIAIATSNALLETTTDSSGRFSLSNVPLGSQTMVIRADGFFATPAGAGAFPQARAEVPVTVGQAATPISVGMVRGGIITGKVVDNQGMPLPFATVQALREVPGSLQPVASRQTDDLGEYRLFWLPPGDYVIGVNPRSPLPANLAVLITGGPPQPTIVRTFFPNTVDVAQASKVAVKTGDEIRGIDISARLDVANPTAPAVTAAPSGTPGVRVSGQIINALIPAVGTGVLMLGSEADSGPVRQVGSVALTAASVPFEIPSVPPGNYDLFVRMPEPRGSVGAGGATQAWGRTTIEVRDRPLDGVQMTLHASVDVPGILRIDGSLAPAGGSMKVVLSPMGAAGRIPNYRGILDRAQAPGDEGKFIIPGAAEGNYDISVQGMPPNAYVADVRQGDTSILASGIGVRDVSPSPFEVLLATDGGVVEGVASMNDKSAGAAANLILVPADRQLLRLAKTVVADGQGRYSIRGVRPGDYKVFAAPSGPLPANAITPENLSKYDAKGVAVTVKAATTATANAVVITD